MSNYRTFLFAAAISMCTIAGSVPGWACSWDSNGVGYPPECGYRGGGGRSGGGGIIGGVINGLLPDANNVVDRANAINAQGIAAQNALNWPLALNPYEQANRINPYNEHIANNLRKTRGLIIGMKANAAYRAHNYALAVSLFEQALAFKKVSYDYRAGRMEDTSVLMNSLEMARAALRNPSGKVARETANCAVALDDNEQLLQREPGNTLAIANIKSIKEAPCGQRLTKQAAAPAKSRAAASTKENCEGLSRADAPDFAQICRAIGREAAVKAQRQYDMDPKHRSRFCGRVLARAELGSGPNLRGPVRWQTKCFWLISTGIRG